MLSLASFLSKLAFSVSFDMHESLHARSALEIRTTTNLEDHIGKQHPSILRWPSQQTLVDSMQDS